MQKENELKQRVLELRDKMEMHQFDLILLPKSLSLLESALREAYQRGVEDTVHADYGHLVDKAREEGRRQGIEEALNCTRGQWQWVCEPNQVAADIRRRINRLLEGKDG